MCEGTDFASATAGVEFDINASIIKNPSCPVLLVAKAFQKPLDEVTRQIRLTLESLLEKGCHVVGTIINRVSSQAKNDIIHNLTETGLLSDQLLYAVPDEPVLAKPTLSEVALALNADVLCGHDQMYRHARSFIVAAMQLRNMFPRITHVTLVITPGDRADIIVACLATLSSAAMEKISGVVLTGGLKPEKPIWDLLQGFSSMVPVLSVAEDTFQTAVLVEKHKGITRENARDILCDVNFFGTMMVFHGHVDGMVSGSVHSKAATIKPALEIIKVREATALVRKKRPDLLVEGPIQYDAAIEPDAAKTKLPDSLVAGRATVFIFPDLNTGNNTYKAVQRSSRAVAIDPVLQGLNKPVNDLSRGCLVADIINTVAITAVQAQEGFSPSKTSSPAASNSPGPGISPDIPPSA